MQKSDPKPFSSRTPMGGRKMAKAILQISLQTKGRLAHHVTPDPRQFQLVRHVRNGHGRWNDEFNGRE